MDNILEKTMFREYDIRGRESESELNANSMLLIGKAYGTFLSRRNIKDVVVGHDSRGTSEEFYDAAIDGLLSAGCRIYEVGTATTPMLYWAQHHFKVKGGLMVTASHNPIGWNGVKLAADYSLTLGEEGIKEIYDIILRNSFYEEPGGKIIKYEDVLKPYADDILGRVSIKKKFKVVVNAGNGTAGPVVPYILRRAGIEVVEHLTNIDSTYPNYTPNPAEVAMIEDTGKVVRENKADFGFAFDGDGDRLGLVDEKGEVIWPDRYFILVSRLALLKKPGGKIVFDVKVSQALPEDIEAHGGIPIMWKTGHGHIKEKMRSEEAILGGELSGHIFFSYNYYGFDDAIFAALNLLEYFSTQDKTVSGIIADTPYYVSSPSLHMNCPEDKKYQVVAELTQEFKKDGYKVIDINGARVTIGKGWGLVRASSNLPVLVLRFEAKDADTLESIKKIFKDKFSKYDFLGKEWTAG